MCNAWNHHSDCICGWGGEGHLGRGGRGWKRGSYGQVPPSVIWSYREDYCAPSTCPECGVDVFFIRHNGGSVWLDSLGWPWPKHPCMDRKKEPSWYRYFKKNASLKKEDGELFNGMVVYSMWQSGKYEKPPRILLAINGGDQGRVILAIKGTNTAKYFMGKIVIVNFNKGEIMSSTHDNREIIESGIDPEILGFKSDWATISDA